MNPLEELLEFIKLLAVVAGLGTYLFFFVRDFFRYHWWKKIGFWLLIVLYAILGFFWSIAGVSYGLSDSKPTLGETVFVYTILGGIPLSVPLVHFLYIRRKRNK